MKPAVVKGIIVGKIQIAYRIMESSASDQVARIQRVPGKLRILQKVLCIPGTTGIFEDLIFLEVVNEKNSICPNGIAVSESMFPTRKLF